MATLTPDRSPDPSCTHKQHAKAAKKPSKFNSRFRKVGQYFKDQALEQTHSALYLSPASQEPQHRISVRSPNGSYYYVDDTLNEALVQKLTSQNRVSYGPRNWAVSPPAYTPASGRSSTSIMDTPASGPGLFQNMMRHQYASDNILQSYDVLIPPRPTTTTTTTTASPSQSTDSPNPKQLFLVYIHGGYFRDPKVDSTSFRPAISLLEAQSSTHTNTNTHISGYASLNYRLSPHPAHQQSLSTTPAYELRTAHWPDQPNDILAALRHLHAHYPVSTSYILIGHSVGATLAFLTVLRAADAGVALPKAVLGVSGIYDFPGIHATNPGYETITRNAMDAEQYGEASPALYGGGAYAEAWGDARRVVVLAHSRDDGLVGWEQVEGMQRVFDGVDGFESELVELRGEHNEIWEGAGELRRAIERTVDVVVGL